jgi:hypothetical protein
MKLDTPLCDISLPVDCRLRLLSLMAAAFRHYFIIDSMPVFAAGAFSLFAISFSPLFSIYAIFIIAFRFSLFTLFFHFFLLLIAAFTMLPPLAPEAIRER